jgi:dolichyl-phosphate-mannose--protein O-mannosyl transferase
MVWQKIKLRLSPTKKLLQTIGEAKPKQYKELPLLNEIIELQTTMVNQNKEIIAPLKKLNSALHMDYWC